MTRDSSSSQTPPRNAALTPTITERTVAITPTTRARMIVSRIPVSTWDKTSCPVCVVPNRCWADGWFSDRAGFRLTNPGSYGSTIGPMIAASRNAPNSTAPIFAFSGRFRQMLITLPPERGPAGRRTR